MRVFIVAGEPSGDKLGGELMSSLRTLLPDIEFAGVGGVKMEAQGLASLFPMHQLSVMGIAEIVPRYRNLMARITETAQHVIDTKADVLITIDSPDFSFRVAKRAKEALGLRTVHYVAPKVWAWRPTRAANIARYIDHVLALFPFEPPYFEEHGIVCDFVGHPVVSEPLATKAEVAEFRRTEGIGDAPLLLVLPGSRRNEVKQLGHVFGCAASAMQAKVEGLRVVVPAAAPVLGQVRETVADWPIDAKIIEPVSSGQGFSEALKRAAFGAADVALAASGTVSLELAAAGTPMVIGYKMHWLSYQIMRRMALVDTASLVNLVSETRTVPEFLGPDCTADALSDGLQSVMENPAAQMAAMQVTMQRLGAGGELPSVCAAKAILRHM